MRRDDLVVFYYLSASEIWPDKRIITVNLSPVLLFRETAMAELIVNYIQ
jgi:hypothetical protein